MREHTRAEGKGTRWRHGRLIGPDTSLLFDRMSVEYTGTKDLPGTISDAIAVFVHDGEVVATGRGASANFTVFREGVERGYGYALEARTQDCRVENELSFLPAGDYDVYMVQRIVNTPQHAAMWERRGTGYTLANAWDGAFYEPGSYDCERARSTSGPIPLECSPNALPGASIDMEERVATLPYSSTWFREELDITLVSEPVTVTITEQAVLPTEADDSDLQRITEVADPQCGTAYGRDFGGLLSLLAADQPRTAAALDLADPVLFGVHTSTEGRYSEVELEGPAPVIFTVEGDLVEHSGMAVRVVGHGWATFGIDGPLEVDRYDGPADLPITFSDVRWCGGSPPEEPLALAHIQTSAVVRVEDGETTAVPAVVANFGAVIVHTAP